MAKTKWVIDPTHSELGFRIKHLMISHVSGIFGEYEVNVETDRDDFSSSQVQAKIKVDSINTNNSQRDQHLHQADFFEIEKYPEIHFQSSRIEKKDDENFTVIGNLTMKGVTKPAKFNVEYGGLTKDPWGNQRAGFMVTGTIKRSDYGVSVNTLMETGGLALGDEVKFHSELQMVKKVDEPVAVTA